MSLLIFALPGAKTLAEEIADHLGRAVGKIKAHSFPDGESYFRILTSVEEHDILLVARLDDPDPKTLPLLLLAAGLRQQEARSITLLAPYLPYMRQDTMFNPGEVVSAQAFANVISDAFDRLITIDPHLHRYHALDELYDIPTHCLSSASAMASWIKTQTQSPYLIGPDEESEQWVSEIARLIDAPYQTLRKTRKGDRNVEITLPDTSGLKQHSIVLVDDIVSSGGTFLQSIASVQRVRPDIDILGCATHGLATPALVRTLQSSGLRAFATTDTVPGPVADIGLSDHIAQKIRLIFNLA